MGTTEKLQNTICNLSNELVQVKSELEIVTTENLSNKRLREKNKIKYEKKINQEEKIREKSFSI